MKKLLFVYIVFSLTSCEELLEIENISNKSITVLAPTDMAVLNQTNLTFNWDTIEGADSYHIQIATPTFNEALQIVKDTLISQNQISITLEANQYQWRVRGENSAYRTPYTMQSFTIEQ
ncbi:hypothetical protein [Pontimicrobium aquaticum]|uniref:Fibronectin type-III domain-containing protein n=1 Tax=Pontimicrobium aquaticum TaxID=2565367 RepID=A0A4U0EZN2_9FLAO|nr:hypothetical protein [Pontimicrobium aquaticum]TJY37398.1 hypothetical protein E5167_05500 [Pontimicrobium aquaticum]